VVSSRPRHEGRLKRHSFTVDPITVTAHDEPPVRESTTGHAKALFSTRRAGSWVRREAVARELDFIVHRWPVLLLLVALIGAAVTPLVIVTGGAVRGFALGAGSASACWAVVFFVAQVSGTASTRMGDFGERSTAQELKKLNGDWQVIHHVWFPYEGDVDHVAVGPGGVLAIESKWRSRAWKVTPPDRRVLAAAREADEHADSIRELLAQHGVRVKVIPALAWWSGQSASIQSRATRQVGKTYVLPGRDLKSWIGEQDGRLDRAQITAIIDVLTAHAAVSDASEELARPESWWSILLPLAATPVAFVLGLFATFDLWLLVHDWIVFAAGTAVLVGLGIWCRRWRLARPAAMGWIVGIVGAAVASIVFAVLA
jgi:hypothetical protein